MSNEWHRGRTPNKSGTDFGSVPEKKILQLLSIEAGKNSPDPAESENIDTDVTKKNCRCIRHSANDRQQRRYAKSHICL